MLGFLVIGLGLVVLEPSIILGFPHTDYRISQRIAHSIDGFSSDDPETAQRLAQFQLPPGAKGWVVFLDGKVSPVGATTGALPVNIPESAWSGTRSHLIVGDPKPVYQFGPLYDSRKRQVGVSVLDGTRPHPPPSIVTIWLPIIGLFLFGLLGALMLTLLVMGRFDKPLLAFRRYLQLYGTVSPEPIHRTPLEFRDLSEALNQMKGRMDVAQDSLRVAMRKATEAERVREEFLADVSHGLGTPLGVVQGWLGFLSDSLVVDETERRKLFEKIVQELKRIDQMVERMDRLAEWEQVKPEIRLTEFSLQEPLTEVLRVLEPQFEALGIRVVREDLSEIHVLADRGWTREILQVFLENVCRHGKSATTVEIKACRQDHRVVVTIKDDGTGIKPELLATLSQRYAPGAAGSGLGLAMAKKLTQNQGGSLQIESKPNEGTTVRFSLPDTQMSPKHLPSSETSPPSR